MLLTVEDLRDLLLRSLDSAVVVSLEGNTVRLQYKTVTVFIFLNTRLGTLQCTSLIGDKFLSNATIGLTIPGTSLAESYTLAVADPDVGVVSFNKAFLHYAEQRIKGVKQRKNTFREVLYLLRKLEPL